MDFRRVQVFKRPGKPESTASDPGQAELSTLLLQGDAFTLVQMGYWVSTPATAVARVITAAKVAAARIKVAG